MRVHLVNPSHLSFGSAIITPRWLYVIAAATPQRFGDPVITDETLQPLDLSQVEAGDVVGIGVHTLNVLRGYEVGRLARARGAFVVFGGIHASLYPDEVFELGHAHAVVKGDGDLIWSRIVSDCMNGSLQRIYDGGRVSADDFVPARWDLLPRGKYMWGSVQTVRGCPKHCSFCSVWRTDGQQPRQRASEAIVQEIVELRRLGFRFVTLADDNFYPVTLEDLRQAERRRDSARLTELKSIREERFGLMARLAKLPKDMILFTQITMEAAEDPEFLRSMQKARIKGTVVGVESTTAEGLKAVHKGFNSAGDELVRRLRAFRQYGIHVLGSFIFGLPTDRPETFDSTVDLAQEAEVTIAQFGMLTPFPGTTDFQRWENSMADDTPTVDGIPVTRYWLIPQASRPKLYLPHPSMSPAEIRQHTQSAWDRFYSLRLIWERARRMPWRARLVFMLMSKLYRQMYANTGIATDSARVAAATAWARWLAGRSVRLFQAAPMPGLQLPEPEPASTPVFANGPIKLRQVL
jgi:tRNA A37 methylthiotransferase MiaB